MAKHTFGLASVEIAPLANDGDVGTSWVTVGETVTDSATLTSSAPTTTDFKVEESDAPVESVVSDPGTQTFKWSSFNVDPITLTLLFGGTTAVGPPVVWSAPDVIPVLERSIRLTDKKGNVVIIARAQIATTLALSFAKTKLGQLDMTATVLQPTKNGVKRLTIEYHG